MHTRMHERTHACMLWLQRQQQCSWRNVLTVCASLWQRHFAGLNTMQVRMLTVCPNGSP